MVTDVITVLVAAGGAAARSTLRGWLDGGNTQVIGEACDTDEVVELALELRPEVCVIEIDGTAGLGLGAAAVLTGVLDDINVVLVATELTVADVVDAIRVGAAGCVSKTAGERALTATVTAVAFGESAFPRRELRQALSFLVPQVA